MANINFKAPAIPEHIFFTLIKEIIAFLKSDLKSKITAGKEEESMIWYLFGGTKFQEEYDYYKQAKVLFSRTETDSRNIITRLFFDVSKANMPSVSIVLGSEGPGPTDSLGMGLGYAPTLETDDQYREVFNRSFKPAYNLILTSDNFQEVLVLYHALKAMLVSTEEVFLYCGLKNLEISGQDLVLNPEMFPPNIFYRALSIGCYYELDVPSIFAKDFVQHLFLEKIILEDRSDGSEGERVINEEIILQ